MAERITLTPGAISYLVGDGDPATLTGDTDVQNAAVGSLFLRRDGPGGATLYKKVSAVPAVWRISDREVVDVRAFGAIAGSNKDGAPGTDSLEAFKAAALACYAYHDEGAVSSASNGSADESTLTDTTRATPWETSPQQQWRTNLPSLGGTITAITSTRLTNSAASFAFHQKSRLVRITSGAGVGQIRSIVAAGSDYVDIDPSRPFSPVPSTGDSYEIIGTGGGISAPSDTAFEVAIIAGTGRGQWRVIVAHTGTTLYLDRPWKVIPDSTSRYRIMYSALTNTRRWDRPLLIPSGHYRLDLSNDEFDSIRGVVGAEVLGMGFNMSVIEFAGGLLESSFTGVSATTLTKSGALWQTNQWKGTRLWVWTPERAIKLRGMVVASNTSDTVTLSGAWPVASTGAAADTQSASTLKHSGSGWTVDQFRFAAVRMTSGAASGQVRFIDRNDGDTLYLTSNWSATPSPGDQYVIEMRPDPAKDTFALAVEHGLHLNGVADSTFAHFGVQGYINAEIEHLVHATWRRPDFVPHEIQRVARSTSGIGFDHFQVGGRFIDSGIFYGQYNTGYNENQVQIDNGYWNRCRVGGFFFPGVLSSHSHYMNGWLLGGGAFANPLINTFVHPVAVLCQNGLHVNYQDAAVYGGVFQSNGNDVNVGGIPSYFCLKDQRSESSGRCLYSIAGNGLNQYARIEGLSFFSDGKDIQSGRGDIVSWSQPGQLSLSAIQITGGVPSPTTGAAASGSTSSTMKGASVAWGVNAFAGSFVLMTSGSAKGEFKQIATNTADTLTLVGAWASTPVAGDAFSISSASYAPSAYTTGSGSTLSSLRLNGQVMVPGRLDGQMLYLTSGALAGQSYPIKYNSSDTIYLDGWNFPSVPASGVTLVVDRTRYNHFAFTSAIGQAVKVDGVSVLGTPVEKLIRGNATHRLIRDYVEMGAGATTLRAWPGPIEIHDGYPATAATMGSRTGEPTLVPDFAEYGRGIARKVQDGTIAPMAVEVRGGRFALGKGARPLPAEPLRGSDGGNVLLRQVVDLLADVGLAVDDTTEGTSSAAKRLVQQLGGNRVVDAFFIAGQGTRSISGSPARLLVWDDVRCASSTGRVFFDGDPANKIDLGNYTGLNGATKASVQVWFTYVAGSATLFKRWGGTNSTNQLLVGTSGDRLLVQLGDGASTATATGSTPLVPGRHYKMTVIFDGAGVGNSNRLKVILGAYDLDSRRWIDALTVEPLAFSGSMPSAVLSVGSQSAIIGSAPGAYLYIDEVRVWSGQALTISQARDQRVGVTPSPTAALRYTFDGSFNNSGTTAGFNGTVTANVVQCSDDLRWITLQGFNDGTLDRRLEFDVANQVVRGGGAAQRYISNWPAQSDRLSTSFTSKSLVYIGSCETNPGTNNFQVALAPPGDSGNRNTGIQAASAIGMRFSGAGVLNSAVSASSTRRLVIGERDDDPSTMNIALRIPDASPVSVPYRGGDITTGRVDLTIMGWHPTIDAGQAAGAARAVMVINKRLSADELEIVRRYAIDEHGVVPAA